MNVPRMFRAQVQDRCQLQRLPQARTDAYRWVDEWIDGVEETVPNFGLNAQTREYQIAWRFVTNSGQDATVIRPVIGANGFPYYPGSSMKGAFKRACSPEQKMKYCGGTIGGETYPGCLRFHGGYPKNLDWIEQELVDVVHPQEGYQVKRSNDNHSAFVQISLYKPLLVFGISTNQELSITEWEEVWQIWERTISKGIGLRVSAGYGQPINHVGNCLFSIHLRGQGLASKLINDEGEFRPNLFKAALRGHTLRLLGGVTDQATAEKITKQIWGGFAGRQGAIVGQVGISFESVDLTLSTFTYTPNINPVNIPIFNLNEGRLDILKMKILTDAQTRNLQVFLTQLIKFSLLLGGFGKSWRRVDHRLFYPDYLDNNDKPVIGCHWRLTKNLSRYSVTINYLEDITTFLNSFYTFIQRFVTSRQEQLSEQGSNWREAFHPSRVQVWGRLADSKLDSHAIDWFHGCYQGGNTIKGSDLTGRLNRIGRIWHRMYPHFEVLDQKVRSTGKYVEILTIFPDDSQTSNQFLEFLQASSDFQLLWPLLPN
jgi:CRISPR-associated protein Cmr6